MSTEPLIGVSTSEVRRPADHRTVEQGEPPGTELALGERYLHALRKAGALPVILAPVRAEAVDRLLDRLDGLCLSGGPDLDPHAYGAPEHPCLGPTEPDLDRFELTLARRAVAQGLPLLAICRGLQVLNVALGGTLHQHLPDLGTEIDHRQDVSGPPTSHEVELSGGSRLEALIGARTVEVNSFHHQAIDTPGRALRVVGRAHDGVVEAVEGSSGPFLFGVQWHAESLVDRPLGLALFKGLVTAASERSKRLERAA